MTDKLLPCPFCRGNAEVKQVGSTRSSHIIWCSDCRCSLETGEVFNLGKAWNTRAEPKPRQPKLPVLRTPDDLVKTVNQWKAFAHRDDCLARMVPSDLRLILSNLPEDEE